MRRGMGARGALTGEQAGLPTSQLPRFKGRSCFVSIPLLLAGSPNLAAWWDRVLYLYCWALEGVYNPVTVECVTAFVP